MKNKTLKDHSEMHLQGKKSPKNENDKNNFKKKAIRMKKSTKKQRIEIKFFK